MCLRLGSGSSCHWQAFTGSPTICNFYIALLVMEKVCKANSVMIRDLREIDQIQIAANARHFEDKKEDFS